LKLVAEAYQASSSAIIDRIMEASRHFVGPCTNMRLERLGNQEGQDTISELANIAEPSLYNAPNVTAFRVWEKVRIIRQAYGLTPLLIVIFFLLWSSLIFLRTREPLAVFMGSLARFAAALGTYMLLAQYGIIWWDSLIGAGVIAIGCE